MPASVSPLRDVFTAREIARAAGVPSIDVRTLIEVGQVVTIDGRFVGPDEAIRAVRLLQGRAAPAAADRHLFQPRPGTARQPGVPILASSTLHLVMLALFAFVTVGLSSDTAEIRIDPKSTRLVFLARPGPGGGGGGGGLRQPAPPARAALKGRSPVRSPIPVRRVARVERPDPPSRTPPPPRPEPVAQPAEPPPPPAEKPQPAPPIVAPVASVAADTQDRAGVLADSASTSSHGPGSGGGTGSGTGTGMGEGDGSGIGPGSGGGTGGGPYRPGSGVTPPGLLREVKPEYTEDARRRNLEGEVVLEIVVRSDGTVGQVKLLSGLGAGLDQRAIDAVRQWRFSPARRLGAPVDVMVEVAVEFRLR